MATQAEILQALRNAHLAGDTAAAQRLAKMYKQGQPDSNVVTGMKDRVAGIAQGIVELPQTVTEAITGVENPRLVFGDGDGQLGVGDFIPKVMTAEEADAMGTTNPFGFTGDEFQNTANEIKKYRGSLNYAQSVPWSKVKSDPSFENIAVFIGETTATSLPDMAAALISTPAYFASYIAPIAQQRAENDGRSIPNGKDLAAAIVASGAIATAERIGAKGIFKGSAGSGVTGRVASATAKESATEGIQNPLQYGAETIGTEQGFDPEVALDQTLAGMVGGAGAGGTIRTTIEGAQGLNSVVNPKLLGEDQEAAADLARDIRAIAEEKGINLKDVNVDSTSGGRAALDSLHTRYSNEVNALLAELRPLLKPDIMDSLETRANKIVQRAAVRASKTKVKDTASTQDYAAIQELVGNYSEGEQLVKLMRKLDEMTRLRSGGFKGGVSQFTDILNPLASAGNYNAARNTVRGVIGLGTGAAAVGTGGASLIPQIAAVGVGRAVDAVTGRRARVAKYVRDNLGRNGLPDSQLPSFIGLQREEAQRREAERLRAEARRRFEAEQREARREQAADATRRANRAADAAGASPSDQSPVGKAIQGTGLTPEGLELALDIVGQNNEQAVKDAVRQLRQSRTEGRQVDNLTPLIRLIRQAVISNPDLRRYVARLPDDIIGQQDYIDAGIVPQGQAPSPTGELDPNEGLTPAQRRGKAANIAFIATLRSQLAGDTTVDPTVKDAIDRSLQYYGDTNLGQDPVAFIKDDMRKLVNHLEKQGIDRNTAFNAIDKYVGRYLDRVEKQQAANTTAPAPEPTPEPSPAPAPEPQQPLNPTPRGPILEEQGDRQDDQPDSGSGQDVPQGTQEVSPGQPDADTIKRAEKAQAAIFEVGKEGSKYENGLSEVESARTIAEALGFKFVEYKNLKDLKREQPGAFKSTGFASGQVKLGERLLWVYTGSETPPNMLHNKGYSQTLLSKMGVIFHELGHVLDLKDSPPTYKKSEMVQVLGRRRIPQDNSTFAQPLMRLLPKTKYEFEGIGKELRDFQMSRISSGNPILQATDDGARGGLVRSFFGLPEGTRMSNRGKEHERGYLSDPTELIADALMGYMMNPKDFRQKYPKTAKFIREAASKDEKLKPIIQFYSVTPLLLAGLILTSILTGSDDDEENTGVLSAPSGALTA